MAVSSYADEMPDALKHHLEILSNSVRYYYDQLDEHDLPIDLIHDLVVGWHEAKVGAWRDEQTLGEELVTFSRQQPRRTNNNKPAKAWVPNK